MQLTKKEQDLLDQMINVIAKVGQHDFETMITRKRDEIRIEVMAANEQRFADEQAQKANEEAEKNAKIVAYYADFLNYPMFAISAENILNDEPVQEQNNFWYHVFRRYGEFSNSNPYLRLDYEQQLYFLGLTNLKVSTADQVTAVFPYWFDRKHVTLQDIMDNFTPIDQIDPATTFADVVGSIQEKLVAKYNEGLKADATHVADESANAEAEQARLQAIEDGLSLID